MRGKDNHGEGRVPATDEEKRVNKIRDISEIDCQEGTMERGETGGNFQSTDNEKQQQEKNPQ